MRLLDLYSCAGGAAMGYHRAGFTEIVGVDINNQPRYPFTFVKGDALGYLKEHGHEFDAIHASPPCQHASAGTRALRAHGAREFPKLIEPTRAILNELGKPYVIENVKGADLRDPLLLCGTMFGLTAIDDDGTPLEMWRHRLFESNMDLLPPMECQHGKYAEQVAGSYGGARRDKHEARHVRHGGYVPSKAIQAELLGIDWMAQAELFQSIPPAYAQHLGVQILERIAVLT